MKCRPWTGADVQRAIKRRQGGMALADIAETLGRSKSSIRQILWRNRILQRELRRTTQNDLNRMAAMAAAGMTKRDVERETGMCRSAVQHWARRRGIVFGLRQPAPLPMPGADAAEGLVRSTMRALGA